MSASCRRPSFKLHAAALQLPLVVQFRQQRADRPGGHVDMTNQGRVCPQPSGCEAGVVLWFDARGEISNLYAHDLPSPQVLAGWFAAPTGTNAPPHLAARSISPVHRKKVVEICADGVPGERIERDKGPEPLCPHRRLCSMAVRPGHHCSVCAARSPGTVLPSPRSLSIGHPQGALSAARSGSRSRRPVDTCR